MVSGDDVDGLGAIIRGILKAYVQEHFGFKVSTLNIAQVKRKYGIIERECYNKAKTEDAKQPGCPEEKEKAIEEAMRFFGMIK